MAERTVQTVKGLLKKPLQDNKDPYLALLNFRTSPKLHSGPSPAFKLYNRNPRTLLPSVSRAKDTQITFVSKRFMDQHNNE